MSRPASLSRETWITRASAELSKLYPDWPKEDCDITAEQLADDPANYFAEGYEPEDAVREDASNG